MNQQVQIKAPVTKRDLAGFIGHFVGRIDDCLDCGYPEPVQIRHTLLRMVYTRGNQYAW